MTSILKVSIVGAVILLISFGGAIWAAPVTIPVLVYAIWRDGLSRRWRSTAILVLALTVAQCVWAIAYVTVGESNPIVWLAPVVVFAVSIGAGTVFLFRRAYSDL